ncbi:hypothetical protein T10_9749 [Trichinella papuae]|uniref:Uncharacterized protein n=1 Tax=Trichinella papuae TaxID=268474 RepID=A0A0V1N5C9_9BILA|nr:hypothetical protein T10_9749 [Trichinella papuae]
MARSPRSGFITLLVVLLLICVALVIRTAALSETIHFDTLSAADHQGCDRYTVWKLTSDRLIVIPIVHFREKQGGQLALRRRHFCAKNNFLIIGNLSTVKLH